MTGIQPSASAQRVLGGATAQGGGTSAADRVLGVGQAALNVNGVDITREDYDRALEHGVLPPGAGFTAWMQWALKNPIAATGQLAKGIAGFVVETGKDMVAIGEWAEVQTFGEGSRTEAQLEEMNHRALRGAAFLGSMVAFGGLGRIAFKAAPLVANLGRGLVSGAVYGGIRPMEPGEDNRDEMIVHDALMFGAMGLAGDVAGGVFRKLRGKPADISPFGPTEHSRMLRRTPEFRTLTYTWEQAAKEAGKVHLPPKGRMAYDDFLQWRGVNKSAGMVEEAIEQAKHLPMTLGDLKTVKPKLADGTYAKVEPAGHMYVAIDPATNQQAFGATVQEALDQLGLTSYRTMAASLRDGHEFIRGVNNLIERQQMGEIIEAGSVRPLGPLYKGLMPVHTWERVWPEWRGIWDGARQRRLMQEVEFGRWQDLIMRTKFHPLKNPSGLKKTERIALGDLLNQYATADQLPKGTSQRLAKAFGEWRAALDMDRAQLAKLFGKTPDEWGLDAYFMHVWAGDWMVADKAGRIIRFGEGASGEAGIYQTAAEARAAAERYLDLNPSGDVQIRPRRMVWDKEYAGGVAMEPGQYITYLRNASDVLGVSSIGKIKLGGQKWFANALDREAMLPGWLRDPTDAAQIYARGYSRKVAYHNFADEVKAAVDHAYNTHAIDGTFRDAAMDWVNRVVGRPTASEQGWNKIIDWFAARPGTPEIVSRGLGELRLRRLSGNIRKVESMWRLGYSPLSAFVNLSQTYVNTASKIGYRDTGTGINLMFKSSLLGRQGNKQLAASIDNLLVEMGVEFQVPLAALGDATFGATHKLSPWSPLYMFNKVETANRGIASLAGYTRELKRAGYTIDDLVTRGEGFTWRKIPPEVHERAIAAGKRLSDEVNFVYSVEDLPGLIAGPAGQVLGQFKPFLINEINFVSQLKGAERVRFAAHLATAGGLGAVMSLPIINLVDYASGEITGERISEYAKRKAPRLARGLLGALGFSAEQSLALNSIMAGRTSIGEATEFSDVWKQALGAELGPFAGDAFALGQLFGDLMVSGLGGKPATTPEQRRLIARQLYPTMVRRVMDAYTVAERGQVTSPITERPIFAPDNPRQEALLTFMGFRSVELEEAKREQATTQRVVRQLNTARTNYMEQILKALQAGDTERVRATVREARRHDIYIGTDDIKNAVRRGLPTTTEQARQQLPRELRRRYGDLYRSTLPSNEGPR